MQPGYYFSLIWLLQICINLNRGKLVLKEAPRIVSERDDRLLVETMDRINEHSDDSESEELSDTFN